MSAAGASLPLWRRALRRLDGPLGAALLVLAGGTVFALLGSEVSEGETRAFDERLLLALRDPADRANPLGPPWLEESLRDVTGLGGATTLALLVVGVVGLLLLRRQRRTAAVIVASVAGGLALSGALKHVYGRPRPVLVPHGSYVYTSSFPSGHAAMSAVTFLTLAALLAEAQPRLASRVYLVACAALLTLAVGFSRVYLGVHYPSDVAAGWIFGATWSAACWLVARSLPEPPWTAAASARRAGGQVGGRRGDPGRS